MRLANATKSGVAHQSEFRRDWPSPDSVLGLTRNPAWDIANMIEAANPAKKRRPYKK